MKEKGQEILNKNYDKLEDDKKDILLTIGEKLLCIQTLVNKEKILTIKTESEEVDI